MNNHLFLIGYRGTGKTVMGKEIARMEKLPFIDLDKEIETQTQKSIPHIFEKEGETAFRTYETHVLKEAVAQSTSIISCGGGVVLSKENRALLKNNGIVCLLTSDPEVIHKRIAHDSHRPRLTTEQSLFDEIKSVLVQREPLYKEVQDFIVDTTITSTKRHAATIIAKYHELHIRKKLN